MREFVLHAMSVSLRHDVGNAHRHVGDAVLIDIHSAHEYLDVAVRLLFFVHETPKSEHGIILHHDPQ